MNSDNEQNDMNSDNEENDMNGNKAVMHLTYNDIKTGNKKSIKLNCNAKENFSNMKNVSNKIINSVNKYKNPLN